MPGRRERVLEPDLGRVAAAQHRAVADVVGHAGLVAGRALDDELRREPSPGLPASECSPVARPPRPAAGGDGVAAAASRRSFSALRVTHSRNRYSTIRKPYFSRTETGSSTVGSVDLEGDLSGPQLHQVAVRAAAGERRGRGAR